MPADELDGVVQEMAEQIVRTPKITVKLAREVIRHLSLPELRASMADELTYQTTLNRSDDFAELRPPAPSSANPATPAADRPASCEHAREDTS